MTAWLWLAHLVTLPLTSFLSFALWFNVFLIADGRMTVLLLAVNALAWAALVAVVRKGARR